MVTQPGEGTAGKAGDLVFDVLGNGALARSPAVGRLRTYCASLLSGGFPPSISLAVVGPEGVVLQAYGGWACLADEVDAKAAATLETRYDLASLTKVVCTTTLVLMARQRGALALHDPVVRWLPRFPQPRTTLEHLLTHTSGLVDHVPFYATAVGRGPIEAALYAAASASVPGSPVRYSDLNFMLLGWVLEACLGRSLDEAFALEVAEPLGLHRTRFRPPPADRSLTAATELHGDQRPAPGLVWGEVHDGNAFALGGVAGHAGLFAPLGDLARFVQALLAPEAGRLLSAESIALMSSRHAASAGDVRGIGWRLEPENWGPWPPGTIWHTGFTGTSLVVAPGRGAGVVLLTNSVHPRRRLDDQAVVRAEVHRLVAEALP
jgi:CubicO group peptidase (beta-lactamase class C family)